MKKTIKFLLRGIMYEVTLVDASATMRDDRGTLAFNKGEWIRSLSLGPVEIIGFNDMGVIVPWEPAGLGRRIVDWAEAYDMNRYGSIEGDAMGMAN